VLEITTRTKRPQSIKLICPLSSHDIICHFDDCQMTLSGAGGMAKPIRKQDRGRPPKHGEAMTGAEHQALYAKARQRDMARILVLKDDYDLLASFDALLMSDDGNR
jgi:hypothetical protein